MNNILFAIGRYFLLSTKAAADNVYFAFCHWLFYPYYTIKPYIILHYVFSFLVVLSIYCPLQAIKEVEHT